MRVAKKSHHLKYWSLIEEFQAKSSGSRRRNKESVTTASFWKGNEDDDEGKKLG